MDSIAILATAGIAFFGFVGALIGSLWKFSKNIDRMSVSTERMEKKMDAQWGKLDEHGACLEVHGNRLIALETKTDYIEKRIEARV